MIARRPHGLGTRRRSLGREDMARVTPLPPPEEVFADWLLSVPHEDCMEAAARFQIELIDRSPAASHPDVRHLRLLLVAVAGDGVWQANDQNL
jgi:hypothetical protein